MRAPSRQIDKTSGRKFEARAADPNDLALNVGRLPQHEMQESCYETN